METTEKRLVDLEKRVEALEGGAHVSTGDVKQALRNGEKEFLDWMKEIGLAISNFDERSEAFRRREKILDGDCIHEKRTGVFNRESMERSRLMPYTGKQGKTRIVIEYNNDTGQGWLRSVTEHQE